METRMAPAPNPTDGITNNPRFQELVRERSSFAWTLSIVMLVIYYGFILLVAFGKGLSGDEDRRRRHLGRHHASASVVIISAFVLTGIYTHRANSRFDELTENLHEGTDAMNRLMLRAALPAVLLAATASVVLAAGPDLGAVQKQGLNWTAIVMFLLFVLGTLGITYRAATQTRVGGRLLRGGRRHHRRSRTALAIAGDYMSAASFLGISGLVFASGFDGLIYSIGFLVGWPIVLFLIAERLRNLGKFTFADVASFRLDQTQIRILLGDRHPGGGGVLPDRPDGRRRQADPAAVRPRLPLCGHHRRHPDDRLRRLRRHEGDDLGADHQGLPAARRRDAAWRFMVLLALRLQPGGDVRRRRRDPSEGRRHHGAGRRWSADPISAISLGLALMFGTAGLPHILMRFFTVSDAKAARKSVFYATGFIGYFYILTFIIGFGAITFLMNDPSYFKVGADGAYNKITTCIGGTNMAAIHLANATGGSLLLGFISAVAFATILAVVAGLTLAGASAVSHDLYAAVIARGRASEQQEVSLSKIAADRDRHRRDRPRLHLREPERRVHGRPRLRGRGELQLPGPADVDALEGHDHAAAP